MPVKDGYEATIEIRSILEEREMDQPCICAVTGHIEEEYVNRCKESGMDLVFSKPVSV
jgi:CheY-like chemotaxis protein